MSTQCQCQEASTSAVSKTDGWCETEFQSTHFSYLWTIKNFSVFPWNYDERLKSSEFTVDVANMETKWYLECYKADYEEDGFSLYLGQAKLLTAPELFIKISSSIINRKGERIYLEERAISCDSFGHNGGAFIRCIHPHVLKEEYANELLPGDKLTIRCEFAFSMSTQKTKFGPDNCENLKSQNALRKDLQSLLDSKDMSDVTLLVSGKEFEAHKNILSARSAVFKAMFQSQMKESVENKVKIDDINFHAFEIVLKYIYTGKTSNLKGVKIIQSVLYAANKYDLRCLKSICELELSKRISIQNASQLLTVADLNNANVLKERTTKFIMTHLKGVIETEALKLNVPAV